MPALAPARTKYRKSMKGSRAGNAKRGNTLAFGEFGLQSLSRGPMTGQQIEAARSVVAHGSSVRETERLVARLITAAAGKKTRRVIDRDILRLQEELAQKLGTKVTLKSRSKGCGSLVIDYASLAQLDTILARLMR